MKVPSSLLRFEVIVNNKENVFSVTLFLVPCFNHVFLGRSVGPSEQRWRLNLRRGGICKFRQLQESGRGQLMGHCEGDKGFPAPHSQS